MLGEENKSGQLSAVIRRRIESGEYETGQKLPSARRLAEQFAVSPVTASLAIAQLKSRGLVETRRGSGTYVLPAGTGAGPTRCLSIGLVYPSDENSYVLAPTSMHPLITDYLEGLESTFNPGVADIRLMGQDFEDRFQHPGSKVGNGLRLGQLDGLVLVGWRFKEDMDWIKRNHMPTVVLGDRSGDADIPYVRINTMYGFRLLCAHLAEHGHRTMDCIVYSTHGDLLALGAEAYVRTARQCGFSTFSIDNLAIVSNHEHGKVADYLPAVTRTIERRPDSVICDDEVILKHLLWQCLHDRLEVPRQMSVASMSDTMIQTFPVRFTALNMSQMHRECARLSGEMLAPIIRGEPPQPRQVEVTPSLVPGETVARRNSGEKKTAGRRS